MYAWVNASSERSKHFLGKFTPLSYYDRRLWPIPAVCFDYALSSLAAALPRIDVVYVRSYHQGWPEGGTNGAAALGPAQLIDFEN
ncbi:hypothetical protein AVEN_210114-1 [Araneus ventricosus]|uniref:Uncharacterized protein n=1 Tax=Araneus ventricosus TaxID=182803 RepID=A0A4Y2CVW2_ARAVE|nr:hypothetical protein AVEN_61932-1 [Araneus ventricosus]GBM08620.1 hypothetical protein AVEN_210114-1 [Araneus ventricosus]